MVFSHQGFIKLARHDREATDFISKEAFIDEGVTMQVLRDIPFFKKFLSMKVFKAWRYSARARHYNQCRAALAHNFMFAKPVFSERFMPLVTKINETRFLQPIVIEYPQQYGKHQQYTIEERCETACANSTKALENQLTDIKRLLHELKRFIQQDERDFENAVRANIQKEMLKVKSPHPSVVPFTGERAKIRQEEHQRQ